MREGRDRERGVSRCAEAAVWHRRYFAGDGGYLEDVYKRQGGEFIALTDDDFGVGGSGAHGFGDDVGGELLEVLGGVGGNGGCGGAHSLRIS